MTANPERLGLRQYTELLIATVVTAFLLRTFVIDAVIVPSASMARSILPGDILLLNKLKYGVSLPLNPFVERSSRVQIPGYGGVARGDVMVFYLPPSATGGPDRKFVKRCLGLPGDSVVVDGDMIFVNGAEANPPEPAVGSDAGERNSGGNQATGSSPVRLRVPGKGDLFALNDATPEFFWNIVEAEGHAVTRAGVVYSIDGIPSTDYRVGEDYYFVAGDNRARSYDSREWGFLPRSRIIGEAVLIPWSFDPVHHAAGVTGAFSGIRWERVCSLVQ